MNKSTLKLAIIRQVIHCEDERVLRTLQATLANLAPPAAPPADERMIAAILGEEPAAAGGATDAEIADLQGSIDEVFGS